MARFTLVGCWRLGDGPHGQLGLDLVGHGRSVHPRRQGAERSARSRPPLRLRPFPQLSLSASSAERSVDLKVINGGGMQPLWLLEAHVRCLGSENHKGPRRSGGRESIAGTRHVHNLHVVVAAPTTFLPGCQPDELGRPTPQQSCAVDGRICCGLAPAPLHAT